ncbi:recombination and DNA strand exchange inhibitor protein [Helicobacter saguini]|uniref:Recombination and DNA strand exchange inhibitor protein n=1 Tax=Helicobacter saguini TaxID=1548018 RepID=A0A347W4H2_9HELI|nr:Smr/MutS family protein [Helicobacter saguini]MWV61846.1 recombination and DNA strand exchange inhibitor protein [Helicobacter saguini]MWV67479.1 recombination and DNA strand exchange inhibitor protein [Helicobacter saguini]MWV69830.1 recombination and DNA strand exchange inhibitor protein [Helicobacter saguini]MWV72952.1 recombination and DNA strand exchange inhibitor protein [Helicobacter saguini]TLD95665.1 recombination and DNA strand exchange inhibitor protein [Helicobacter saguini]
MNEFELSVKLSILPFLKKFASYFSREIFNADVSQNLDSKILSHILNINDIKKTKSMINTLDSMDNLPSLPRVKNLDNDLKRLKKGFFLHLKDIAEFVKIILFFNEFLCYGENLKSSKNANFLKEYCSLIKIPNEVLNLANLFDLKNKKYLKHGACESLDSLEQILESKLKQKNEELYLCLKRENLQEFLVDSNIHFIENESAILLRAGFSNVLKAKVIGRSHAGFFYVIPLSLSNLQEQIYALQDKIELQILELSKDFSSILSQHFLFLKFINNEFDFLDSIFSRLNFAKEHNFEFIFPKNIESSETFLPKSSKNHNKDSIILRDFIHPILHSSTKAIPTNIDFNKNLLMITGVNAGGKTMLLKSILTASFCTKKLLPQRMNAAKSSIPFFKNIAIIAQDPQDSSSDISTFSGRIKEISQILHKNDLLLGIDEIEIGTDSSEAAALYKAILEYLLDSKKQDSNYNENKDFIESKNFENKNKIIVTTHHKNLASLMAQNPATQLLAATYDYKNSKPTFSFFDGIGKSYAFECATHYGIPNFLIQKAREFYGNEANKLENLIQNSNEIITKNRILQQELESKIKQNEEKFLQLDSKKRALESQYKEQEIELKRRYNEAIKELKMLAKKGKSFENPNFTPFDNKSQDFTKQIHKTLNKAHKFVDSKNLDSKNMESKSALKCGSSVKYKGNLAKILSVKNGVYDIEFLENNMRLKGVSEGDLQAFSGILSRKKDSKKGINLDMEIKGSLSLDLHGMTQQEALEALESFFSNALAARFSEVEIVHGIGSGALRKLVENYLDNSPFIRGYRGNLAKKIVFLE